MALQSCPACSPATMWWGMGRSRSDDPSDRGRRAGVCEEWIKWGAGPRASQYLILGAKARAALSGRFVPSREDVRAVAMLVLRHRIVTTFAAEAEGVSAPDIVNRIARERM